MNEQLETTTLPLLPLRSGVILPHMVVTIMLETDEARHAVEAAQARDGVLISVPKIDTGFASVGTVAKVEDAGRPPSGSRSVDAAHRRARTRVPRDRREHRGRPRRAAGGRDPEGHYASGG